MLLELAGLARKYLAPRSGANKWRKYAIPLDPYYITAKPAASASIACHRPKFATSTSGTQDKPVVLSKLV